MFTDGMKQQELRCKVLPLGRRTLTGEEQLCCKGPGGPGEQQGEREPALAAKVPTAPGLYEKEQSQ